MNKYTLGGGARMGDHASNEVSSINYNALGQIISYVMAGVTYTISYNGAQVASISDGTTTRTVNYNGDGTVASFV